MKSKGESSKSIRQAVGPALTPEAEEQECIALAMRSAKQQLLDGTASSQIIAHFLKMGSSKERLEQDILTSQNELYKAKTEAINREREMSVEYKKVIEAMKKYSGHQDDEEYEEYPY